MGPIGVPIARPGVLVLSDHFVEIGRRQSELKCVDGWRRSKSRVVCESEKGYTSLLSGPPVSE